MKRMIPNIVTGLVIAGAFVTVGANAAHADSYVPTAPPATSPAVVIPADNPAPASDLAYTGVEPWLLPAWIGGGTAVLIGGGILLSKSVKRRKA